MRRMILDLIKLATSREGKALIRRLEQFSVSDIPTAITYMDRIDRLAKRDNKNVATVVDEAIKLYEAKTWKS